MKISEFVEKYNKLSSTEARKRLNDSIIKRTYAPVYEKKLVLQLMLDKSIVTTDNGVKYIDMFTSKLNFYAAIISLYTNLEYEQNEKGITDSGASYDLIKQYDIIDIVCEAIGENELKELISINDLLIDTFHNQNNNIEAFLADQIKRLSVLLGGVAGAAIEKLGTISMENLKD